MRIDRRAGWGIGFPLVIAALMALRQLLPVPPMLLSRSVAVYENPNLTYQWISDHELLLFKPVSRNPHGKGWQLVRRDLTSGIETPLVAAAQGFPRRTDAPANAAVSPDGRWLLWRDKTQIVAARLDGTRRQTWDDSANRNAELNIGLPHWQNDSSHFIELLTRHADNFYRTPYYGAVLIRDVEAPTTAQVVAIPRRTEFESSYFEPPHATADGNVFAASAETSATKTLLLVPLQTDKPARKFCIRAPLGADFAILPSDNYTPVAFSPRGDRIAWLCLSPPHAPPLQELLHRIFPHVNVQTRRAFNIWISRVDGSDMSELGEIETNDDEEDVLWSEFSNVSWLPTGNSLGFAYNHTIYRVPVN